MRIGELSRHTGASPGALRYYEEQGQVRHPGDRAVRRRRERRPGRRAPRTPRRARRGAGADHGGDRRPDRRP
ncbi:MerR family DNA-binding transcriptional regulator [Streptomyces sp. NPDC003710]